MATPKRGTGTGETVLGRALRLEGGLAQPKGTGVVHGNVCTLGCRLNPHHLPESPPGHGTLAARESGKWSISCLLRRPWKGAPGWTQAVPQTRSPPCLCARIPEGPQRASNGWRPECGGAEAGPCPPPCPDSEVAVSLGTSLPPSHRPGQPVGPRPSPHPSSSGPSGFLLLLA